MELQWTFTGQTAFLMCISVNDSDYNFPLASTVTMFLFCHLIQNTVSY